MSQPVAYLLARNCLISTSGQKSNVSIVFLDPDFLHDACIPAIREYLRQKLAHLCLDGFLGPFESKWQFRGKIGEWVGRCWLQRTRSYFWGLLPLCHFWRKSIKKCGQTDKQTHAQRKTEFIICPLLYAIAMGQIITHLRDRNLKFFFL